MSEYWEGRLKEWQAAKNRQIDALTAKMSDEFSRTAAELEKEILAWYQKYADAGGLTLADAQRDIDLRALKNFRMSLAWFFELAKRNGNGAWEKELTRESALVHVSRLRALETLMKHLLRELYEKEGERLADALTSMYEDETQRMAYETQHASGTYENFSRFPEERVKAVLKAPWAADGANFSERLWMARGKLTETMRQEITRGLITGKDAGEIGTSVAKLMNAARYAGVRLAQTEMTRIVTEADKDTFEEMRIAKVEIIGTLDTSTCGTCGGFDGQVLNRKDVEAGVNAPPFHPNCRCVIAPYVEALAGGGKRAARDPETGQTVDVPEMNYEDWKLIYAEKKMPLALWEKTTPESAIIKAGIRDGSISLKINPEKQARHLKGSPGYIQGRSYFNISVEELQKIVDETAGSGMLDTTLPGVWQKRERIVYNRVIGININNLTGAETATNSFKIHYSKTGVHVVPTMQEA